jgi:orotidine-5'-phosphate decarboxylase
VKGNTVDNPIIVAYDGQRYGDDGLTAAQGLASKLRGKVWGFKLNDFFIRFGWEGVDVFTRYGHQVMLDLNLYDIPNTVKNHCQAMLVDKPVRIVTVHAHGGSAMMTEACCVLPGKIAAVTVLTSFDKDAYAAITGNTMRSIAEQVKVLALVALGCGCSFVVCSGHELETLKGVEIKKIVPGIRPTWTKKPDDQKRTMAPAEAMAAGANYLVIGRPVLEAASPVEAVEKTLAEIGWKG